MVDDNADSQPLSWSLGQAAEFYAVSRGWRVFPCLAGDKRPATQNGFHDSTSDLEQVRRWWSINPQFNVAVATGWGSVDVVDVDVLPTGSGWAARDRLRDAGLLRGAVGMASTPRGGQHLHYVGSEQGNRSLRGHHVDFRGRGGYVLLPPSVVSSQTYDYEHPGGSYAWVHLPVEDYRDGADPIDWTMCVQLLTPPRARATRATLLSGGDDGHGYLRWFARREVGERNSALFWCANRLIELGLAGLLDELQDVALDLGLSASEVQRTIDSAWRTSGDAA